MNFELCTCISFIYRRLMLQFWLTIKKMPYLGTVNIKKEKQILT